MQRKVISPISKDKIQLIAIVLFIAISTLAFFKIDLTPFFLPIAIAGIVLYIVYTKNNPEKVIRLLERGEECKGVVKQINYNDQHNMILIEMKVNNNYKQYPYQVKMKQIDFRVNDGLTCFVDIIDRENFIVYEDTLFTVHDYNGVKVPKNVNTKKKASSKKSKKKSAITYVLQLALIGGYYYYTKGSDFKTKKEKNRISKSELPAKIILPKLRTTSHSDNIQSTEKPPEDQLPNYTKEEILAMNNRPKWIKPLKKRLSYEPMNNEGKRHGTAAYYHENGRLYGEIEWRDGQKVGSHLLFHSSGKPDQYLTYKDGKLDGRQEFYDKNGKLYFYDHRKNNKYHGWAIGIYSNKALKSAAFYQNGKVKGFYFYFDKKGKLKSAVKYNTQGEKSGVYWPQEDIFPIHK